MGDNYYIPHLIGFLAKKYHQNNYFAYEGPQNSFFTLGQDKTIHLYSDRVEVIDNGCLKSFVRARSPSQELDYYIQQYFSDKRRVFGWINFEFCVQELEVDLHLSDGVLLAVLFIPKAEIKFYTSEQFDSYHFEITAEQSLRTALQGIINEKITSTDVTYSYNVENSIDYRLPDTYQDRVKQATLEIKKGYYDKVILSRIVNIPHSIDIEQSYLNGRLANTPARSFIFNYQSFRAFGFSPELILQVREDGQVITEPLAGTRACGLSSEEDEQLVRVLYTDPKEVFEHAISVKTSCEEISRISQDGQAYVTEFMKVKKRGVVQHMASTVAATLASDKSIFSALAALFPSVTASGLPKKEAIEAISRLDNFPRRLYSGGVGYWDPGYCFEMTLVLRSLFQDGDQSYVRVGAGIVSDSDAEREFVETCEKIASIVPYLVLK